MACKIASPFTTLSDIQGHFMQLLL